MELVVFILVAVFLYIIGKAIYAPFQKAKLQRQLEAYNALQLAQDIQKQLERLQSLKTVGAQQNACKKALAKLHAAWNEPRFKEIVANAYELEAQLEALIKIIPIVDKVERAYRNRFKGKENLEKNALLDALYEVQTNNVRNSDFVTANLMPEGTGEIVTVEGIIARLEELGWTGPADGSAVPTG